MKKTILTMVLGLSVFFAAQAQIALGVKAGLNFNQSSIEYAQSGVSAQDFAGSRTGFHFGVFTTINVGPIGIQPEAYYSAQGADISFSGASGAVKTDYLQIPILVRLNFLKFLNVHAGPQFGLLLKETLDGDAQGAVDQALKNDVSIVAGVGVDLPFGLVATVRYVKGLKDSFDFNESILDPGETLSSGKNDMVQLSVGYKLLGK